MDINSELGPLTVYNYEVSSAMDTLVKCVLKRIPDSYAEEFPSFSVFESHSPLGAHVEREGNVFSTRAYSAYPRMLPSGLWLTNLLTCSWDIPAGVACRTSIKRMS